MSKNTIESLLKEWEVLKRQLSDVKEKEMDVRVSIATLAAEGKTGKLKKSFDVDGKTFVVNCGTTLSLDKEVYEKIKLNLKPDAKACIKMTPSLDKKAFDNLNNPVAQKQIISMLVEKPSTPTIKIKGENEDE